MVSLKNHPQHQKGQIKLQLMQIIKEFQLDLQILELSVKKHPSKKKLNFYLKVIKVPTKITTQQAKIAEKIPVLIKIDFLLVILREIFKFERRI